MEFTIAMRVKPVLMLLLIILYFGFSDCIPSAGATESAARPVIHSLIPIVLYHHVGLHAASWTVPILNFEEQLQTLQRDGYQSVSMHAYLDAAQKKTTLPPKSVVLTFDDGYADNYQYAFPLLQRYGFKATFYVIARRIGQKGYMTWAQLRDMQRAGMEIGNHTLDHPFMTRQHPWPGFWQFLAASLEIRWNLGIWPESVAYPYNDHNAAVLKWAKAAGFRGGLIVAPHTQDVQDDLFAIPRITVGSTERSRMFLWIIRRGF